MKTFYPREYQKMGIRHIIGNQGTGLLWDPGLGKTPTVLSAFNILRKMRAGYKALIIAPLPVALNTWPEEQKEWSNFKHLRMSVLHGSKRVQKLKKEADLYILNCENIFWAFDEILQNFEKFPFNMLVIDESTEFKNWSAKRTKVLKKFRDFFDRIVILTGTPIPKGLMDIFPQAFFVDGGRALGRTITPFKNKFFYKTGYKGYELVPYDFSQKVINSLTQHIFYRVNRKQAIELPPFYETLLPVELPPKARKIYDQFEKQLISEIQGSEIFIPSKSQAYNVCRQIASGGLYEPQGLFLEPDKKRKVYDTHKAKIDVLLRLQNELYGAPILLAYLFKFNRKQLEQAPLGRLGLPKGAHKQKQITQFKNQFLKNKLDVFAVHPASVSYGLNLHKGKGRSIVWLGPPNSLVQYIQLNDRLYRPGIDSPVTSYVMVAKRTIEEVVWTSLKTGQTNQEIFLNEFKKYRQKYSIG